MYQLQLPVYRVQVDYYRTPRTGRLTGIELPCSVQFPDEFLLDAWLQEATRDIELNSFVVTECDT